MISNLIKIGFPNNCISCSHSLFRNEKFICSKCLFHIPKGNRNLTNNSEINYLLGNSSSILGSSYLLNFDKKGKTQYLLHELKYKQNLKFGEYLGKLMAIDFKDQLTDIDFIVPVPLHPKKQHQRGYNQSNLLAKGMKQIIDVEIAPNLKRVKNTESQTKKNKEERIRNISHAFSLQHPNELSGKTVLLIDDVITTGSTLKECVSELSTVKDIKIKVLALAKANL